MQRIFDALEQEILPLILSGSTRAVPEAAPDATQSSQAGKENGNFFELYTQYEPTHTFYEWMWMLSGQAHLKVSGRIYDLQKGDFVLLPPLFPHCDVYDRHTLAYQTLWFSFRPGIIHASLFDYQPTGRWQLPVLGGAYGEPVIGTTLSLLQNEMLSNQSFRRETIQGLLIHLVGLSLRALETICSTNPLSPAGSVSGHILHFLRDHYSEDIALNDIARSVHLNPSYAAAVFKKEMGQTIFEVLAQIRVERACQLLLENHSLHEVALAVGYHSVDHFSRIFRRLKGLPPSRYGFMRSEEPFTEK